MSSRSYTLLGLFILASTFSCSSPPDDDDNDNNGARSPSGDDVSAPSTSPPDDPPAPSTPTGDPEEEVKVEQETEGEPTITSFDTLSIKGGNFPTYLAPLLGAKGSPFHLFPGITIENPSDQPKTVVLRASLQGYTKEEAIATVKLDPKSKRTGTFDAALDFEALDKITSTVSAQFKLSLTTPEGKVLYAASRPVQVLSKRTVFWSDVFIQDGKPSTGAVEREYVSGLFTTPNDHRGEIDRLLQKAATFSAYGNMWGYSTCANKVSPSECTKDQVGAIYKALQSMGFNYTSVSNNYFKSSQEIRYPSESLSAKTGNCIDGTLVFTSALEAIGMLPQVVYVTGHAFLAVANGPIGTEGNKTATPVETTMVGIKGATFQDAVISAANAYNNAVNKKDPAFQVVDIARVRGKGITPSPFPM